MDVGHLDVVNSALQEFLLIQTRRAQLYSCFQEGFKEFLRTKREEVYKALMVKLTAAFNECSKKVIVLEGMLKERGRADLAATLRCVQESERDKLRLTLTLQALKQAAAFQSFSWQQQQQNKSCQDGNGYDNGYDDDEALALLDPQFARATKCHDGCAHAHAHAQVSAQSRQRDEGTYTVKPLVEQEEGPLREPCSRTTEDATAAAAAGTDTLVDAGGVPQRRTSGAAEPAAATSNSVQHAAGKAAAGGGCSGGGGGDVAPEPTRREFEAAVKEAMQGLDGCIRKINDSIDYIRMELDNS